MGEGNEALWRRLLRNKMLLLMLGGALGTYCRYGLGKWFNSQPWGETFPFGTLFINVSGSFLLGVAAVIILERLPPEQYPSLGRLSYSAEDFQ